MEIQLSFLRKIIFLKILSGMVFVTLIILLDDSNSFSDEWRQKSA